MKFFSAILGIYIMGLVLVPCVDVHAENSLEEEMVLADAGHEHHFDNCSPFCICECCQTISQEAAYPDFLHFAPFSATTLPYFIASEFSYPANLWRPPKI